MATLMYTPVLYHSEFHIVGVICAMIVTPRVASMKFGTDMGFGVSFEKPIRGISRNQYGGHFWRHFQNGGRRLALFWGTVCSTYLLFDFDV